jgi:hypothetical protein
MYLQMVIDGLIGSWFEDLCFKGCETVLLG